MWVSDTDISGRLKKSEKETETVWTVKAIYFSQFKQIFYFNYYFFSKRKKIIIVFN